MKSSKLLLAIITVSALFVGEANAKGCLTGAAVGGAAGHVAGKHGLIGAGVGCAIGRHRANKKQRAVNASQPESAAPSTATVPVVTAPTPAK